MKRFWIAVALLMPLIVSAPVFGQSTSASLGGTVQDASAAVLPGVKVTATNTGTNITTSVVSNSAGVYNFPSLQPGAYKVSAEMSGFQTHTFTDVQLSQASQLRLNFTLQVRKLEQSVEVSVTGERLLLESSSSVGDVLSQARVTALPSVSNNVLDLIRVMGGSTITNDAIFGANNTTFAGVTANNINIQRDGVTVNDVRYPTGISSPTVMNPDLVGEFRMILTPVDAEVGRGSGQIQVMTKSGANTFHGGLVWNVQNSALDSNQWDFNRRAVTPPWRNQNEYTLSVGGPIIKDKTFFFVLWDGGIIRTKDVINVPVLTPCARKGIFRYWDNWNNGNTLSSTTYTGTPVRPVVNLDGSPLQPTVNPDGTAYTGQLRWASVFGVVQNSAGQALNWDCSNAQVSGTAWDSFRTGPDSTQFISKFIGMMPQANNYDVGDGLNTAGYRWNRALSGADNLYGIGEPVQRKQINVKIDHNFNSRNRISGNWSFEKTWADDSFMTWPNTYGGRNQRQPQVLTFSFTSTIKSTLLNEVRFGMTRTGTNVYSPLDNPAVSSQVRALLPVANGEPIIISPDAFLGFALEGNLFQNLFAVGNGGPSHFYGSRGILPTTFRDSSPRWTGGDTISWTRGKHSFKGGFEIRFSNSYQTTGGNWFAGNTSPHAQGGASIYSSILNINSTNMPGLAGTTSAGNQQRMMELLNFQAGAVSYLVQYRFINSAKETAWNDPATDRFLVRNVVRNEYDWFIKDDWKVNESLTVNLGLRFEKYGVPYVKNGLTAGWDGGGNSIFGISGRSFDTWMPTNPSLSYDSALLAKALFVGPGSPNSNKKVYADDNNNFGPAVGFAWQLPWFGKGKTTLRGGYQISYIAAMDLADASNYIAMAQGTTYSNYWIGDSSHPYVNLATLAGVVPAPLPAGTVPGMKSYAVSDRSQTMTAFSNNFSSPYIQNLTLSLTRNIGTNLTADVRYIGTLSRKLIGTININSPNFLTNNFQNLGSLKNAFDAARSGGESPLLDNIFNGINIVGGTGSVPVGQINSSGVLQTGAGEMRRNTTLNGNLANGNYSAIASSLATMNYATYYPGNSGLPAIASGVNGAILRYNGFPENYIYTNPQFATANYMTNLGTANYHSMQAQLTLRPQHGISLQGTYTWSRNLGLLTSGFTDPRDIKEDYGILSTHRSHTFATYGTWDLPLGPGMALLRDSSGIVSRIAGGWQVSWIGNFSTGSPMTISANTSLYANGVPDKVGPFDTKSGKVTWHNGATFGNYFNDEYERVADPQCSNVASSLQSLCTLQAIRDKQSKQTIFQNAMPGTWGNFGRNNLTGPGSWNVDMALSKAIKITEGKTFQFRVDVVNLFNHPQPGGTIAQPGTAIVYATNPLMGLNDTANDFGKFGSKAGRRTWQAKLRFDF